MKRLIFAAFIFGATVNFVQAIENPRKTLVISIARTDLEGVKTALKQIDDMTQA